MKTILFVDDDKQISTLFTSLFQNTEYTALTASCGAEALDVLEYQKADIIICDMHMPLMDGYQLLQEVKLIYPSMLRIILCDYADEKVVLRAIQQNIAKMYLLKPWKNDVFVNLIKRLFETQELLNGTSLLSLINNIEDLPTIQSSYSRIISMIDNDLDISKISLVIEQDQTITTKILHLVNSAYFGMKIGSIRQAATYLGLQNIRSLVVTTSIVDAVSIKGIGSMFFTQLWNHAFLTNRILTMLFEKSKQKKLSESSVSAGLLHKIGIVLLLKIYPEKYMQLIKATERDKKQLMILEKGKFNTIHPEVGGYLLYWWDLPFPIVEAALYHHIPFDGRIINKELVMAVHIAQKYAGDKLGGIQYCNFDVRVFDALNINRNEFEVLVNSMDITSIK